MTPHDPMAAFSARTFADRRARIREALGGGAMVLASAPTRFRSRDTEYPYRPDSELFWATGVALSTRWHSTHSPRPKGS